MSGFHYEKFLHPPGRSAPCPPSIAVFAADLRLHPTIGQNGVRQIGQQRRFEISMGTSPPGWTPGCPSAVGSGQCGNGRLRSECAPDAGVSQQEGPPSDSGGRDLRVLDGLGGGIWGPLPEATWVLASVAGSDMGTGVSCRE